MRAGSMACRPAPAVSPMPTLPTMIGWRLAAGGLGLATAVYLHIVDTVALVHALLLRLQALILPVQALVFGGH